MKWQNVDGALVHFGPLSVKVECKRREGQTIFIRLSVNGREITKSTAETMAFAKERAREMYDRLLAHQISPSKTVMFHKYKKLVIDLNTGTGIEFDEAEIQALFDKKDLL
jgi:hypothetical protein